MYIHICITYAYILPQSFIQPLYLLSLTLTLSYAHNPPPPPHTHTHTIHTCTHIQHTHSHTYTHSAPGPVRNLIVEFNETTAVFNAIAGTYTITANLTWEEPEEPNGTISTYDYSISLETDLSNIVTNGMSTVTSVQSTVTVLPDVRYRFAVTARTDGGLGESVEEIILSPEAGN